MDNEEAELQERLEKIKLQKAIESREKRDSKLVEIVGKLKSPIAKAKLFGKKPGLIPSEIDPRERKEIKEGYKALEMFAEAEVEAENYEEKIELYILAAQKPNEPLRRLYIDNASYLAGKDLKNPKKAVEVYLQFNMVDAAVYKALDLGEFQLALDLAEKYGCFEMARRAANELGDKRKSEFYEEVDRIRRELEK